MTAPGPDRHLLADLDAGLLDEAAAREVRAAAAADPEAQAVLDALAATRAELAAVPDPPVPPALAARWLAALAAEQSHIAAAPSQADPHTPRQTAADHPLTSASAERPADQPPHPAIPAAQSPPHPADHPPTSPHPPASRDLAHRGRPRRTSARPDRTSAPRSAPPRYGGGKARRRSALLRRPAVVAGVLLVAVVAAAALWRDRAAPGVDRQQLVAHALSAVGAHDTGGLDDPARRAGCLRAVEAPVGDDAPLLGGRQVTFEGRPGVLLVLGTGTRGAFDVVVVDPACGPAGGALLAASRVGQ